jgi:hypothetical protein
VDESITRDRRVGVLIFPCIKVRLRWKSVFRAKDVYPLFAVETKLNVLHRCRSQEVIPMISPAPQSSVFFSYPAEQLSRSRRFPPDFDIIDLC